MEEVEQRVRGQVEDIIDSKHFKERLSEEGAKPGYWVVFNNSFLFREDLKTKKSELYLATIVRGDGSVSSEDLFVVERAQGAQINDVRVMPPGDRFDPLRLALARQIESLGKLVFLLIGKVEQDVQVSQEMTCGPFTRLTLDPRCPSPVAASGTTLMINAVGEPEQMWDEIKEQVRIQHRENVSLGEKDYASFLKALEAVSDQATARLALPLLGQDPGDDTFLDRIAEALEKEAVTYADAVQGLRDGPTQREKYTEVLRIAYNFATEALTLIELFISVCDLKPIVFWTTAFAHWNLYLALHELPWLLLEKKPSFKSYEETVKNARNRAFHHIFPISTTLIADLSGVTLRARSLKLFREYSGVRQRRTELEYEDKELVDVLGQFTRAKERWVGLSFWERNVAVLSRTAELARSTAQALKLLNRAAAVRSEQLAAV